MRNILSKLKLNSKYGQVSSTTIWIIIALFLIFLSIYIFTGKIETFQSFIGVKQ